MTTTNNTSKYRWVVGPIITLVIVFAGFLASWVTIKVSVAEMQKDVIKIEKTTEDLEDKVHDLEVKGAVDSSVLKSLLSDVTEIKSDVKKLLNER